MDNKRTQEKSLAKSNQNTPTEQLSQATEELAAQTETGTVQTDPTSLGGNTCRSITPGETQTDSDFTRLQLNVHKLAERQGQTEQHQHKFKQEIKPIIKNDKEEVAKLKQKIHQLLTDQKATSQQQMEYNEHLIHDLFATKYNDESVKEIKETAREKCEDLTDHHQELTDKLTETGAVIQRNLKKLGKYIKIVRLLMPDDTENSWDASTQYMDKIKKKVRAMATETPKRDK